MNSCVNSPEGGPVGPKHVEIRQYINKIEIVTSVGFIPYVKIMHGTKSLKHSSLYIRLTHDKRIHFFAPLHTLAWFPNFSGFCWLGLLLLCGPAGK